MKVKQFKKTLRYAVGYGATQATLKRLCRASKVKYLPARQKMRIANQVRQEVKAMSFGWRYGAGFEVRQKPTIPPANMVHADLSKLEQRVIASLPAYGVDYLVTH